MPPASRRRLAPLLLAPWLVLVLAAPTGTPAPAAEGVDARIDRCFELRRNRPQQAVELADSLLSGTGLDLERRIKVMSCQGVAATLLGDNARAVTVADAIAAELERHPELPAPFRMRALSNLGGILHGAGQVYRAEKVYAQTVRVGEEIGGTDAVRAQASTLNNIGLINVDYLDAPQAADAHYRQALALTRSLGESNPQILYNFAINQLRLDDRDAALKALEEASEAARSSASVLMELRVRSALSGLRQEGGAEATMRALEQIAGLQAELPDPAGEAATLARLSTIQGQSGLRAQALASARRAYEQARPTHSPQETYQALQALVEALAAEGDTRGALDYAGRISAMKLDALRQQRMDLLADLQARNQDALSQRELERMRYEDNIRRLKEEKSRMLRSAGIGLLVLLLLGAVAFGLLQRRRHQQLRVFSERDALTGLANRHAATAALNALAAQRSQDDARHVLFLIDIDHFKQINDTHGHHAGDTVLAEVSRRLQAACRPGDLVSRWGGEEFLVACANLDPAQAQAVAARLCKAMAYTLETADGERAVTASLGLAPIPFFDVIPEGHVARRWDYALRMADRALYAAKEQRNGWVGYWGARLPDDATAEAVLEFPEAAPGIVHVMSSRPRNPARLREQSLREALAQL
ncbi:tetratricopeptide repeat-containing diguanylate cyclase [Pseudoxanthomonas jiangsuensis]|uniref:tetratricopeptide repeat-containing diguanylate cyclase n=1 Tax=Pseudoxanthomonas jiangsuensis TaxID=619688 RepID=UPI001390DBBC|nr:tetratricopeptide repeat-containing diguanylate cyclase [Pseudoxanthomonas jiangsuensis]